MDSTFWLGIGVATLLAVPAGVLAIWLHGRLVQYLDSRRVTCSEKRLREEHRFHKLILDLRTGRRDKYIYMLRMLIGVVIPFLTAVVCLTGAMIVIPNIPFPSDPYSFHLDDKQLISLFIIAILLFMSMVGLFGASLTLNRFREITNALEDFEKYEKDFNSKWGVSDAAAPTQKFIAGVGVPD
jgi:hypothetical protein